MDRLVRVGDRRERDGRVGRGLKDRDRVDRGKGWDEGRENRVGGRVVRRLFERSRVTKDGKVWNG